MKKHLKTILTYLDKYSIWWILSGSILVLILIFNASLQPVNKPAPMPAPQLDNSNASNDLNLNYKVSEIVNQNGLQIGVVQTNVLRKFNQLPSNNNIKYLLLTVRTINYAVGERPWHYSIDNWSIAKPAHSRIVQTQFHNMYGISMESAFKLGPSQYRDRVMVIQCPVNVNTVYLTFVNQTFSSKPVHFEISV